MDEETNRNWTQPIADQWYQPRQDNNINYYISQPPVETVQSSYSNIVSRKKKKIVILNDSILKNLRMEEFNSFVKEGEVYLKAFPGAKANQLNYQIIPIIQGSNYNAAAMHVGIPLDETHLDAVRGLILPRGFHPAHQQVELVRAMWLCSSRTNRSAYAYARDLTQS